MLGIDTNVLVRFLVRDDEAQFDKARKLIKREANAGQSVLISLLVLLETEWVLRSRYTLTKAEIIGAISALLNTTDVQLEGEPSVEQTLFSLERWRRRFCRLPDRNAQPQEGMPHHGNV